MSSIRGVSLDFYLTLVRPRGESSRGQLYHKYLAEHDLTAEPWEHQVLYDVFEYYGQAYHPSLSPHDKARFWTEFTRRLFTRTGVKDASAGAHAEAISRIFGPAHFAVYPEVPEVLDKLKRRGFCLAMVSNWQKGLSYFCEELGILSWFDVVICSAEVGCEKPDVRVFELALQRLGLEAGEVLHVGDTIEEDIEGARAAGLHHVWLDRAGVGGFEPAVRDLRGIERLLT